MSFLVSHPLPSASSHSGPNAARSYPVIGALPFTGNVSSAASAVPVARSGERVRAGPAGWAPTRWCGSAALGVGVSAVVPPRVLLTTARDLTHIGQTGGNSPPRHHEPTGLSPVHISHGEERRT